MKIEKAKSYNECIACETTEGVRKIVIVCADHTGGGKGTSFHLCVLHRAELANALLTEITEKMLAVQTAEELRAELQELNAYLEKFKHRVSATTLAKEDRRRDVITLLALSGEG